MFCVFWLPSLPSPADPPAPLWEAAPDVPEMLKSPFPPAAPLWWVPLVLPLPPAPPVVPEAFCRQGAVTVTLSPGKVEFAATPPTVTVYV